MLYSTYADLRQRRLIVAGAAVVLLLIAAVAYAVLVESSTTSAGISPRGTKAVGLPAPPEPDGQTIELSALPSNIDPESFSRQVATALFGWDTSTIVDRVEHIEQLVAVADPTGESTPGLVSDVGNYLPSDQAWAELAKYETRQWLSIDSVTIPPAWAKAEMQAGNQLLPGTTALTIRGVRHRAGAWEGRPVASQHEVAFTVFVVCAPSYPECHLLRLSQLDKPLE